MPFSRTGRKRNALITSGAIVAGVGVFGLGFMVLFLELLAPGVLRSAATPFWQLSAAAGTGARYAGGVFGNAAELTLAQDRLVADNEALAEENRALRAQLADIAALTVPGNTHPAGILAGVLSRPPVAPYDTLIVGSGSKQGVATGMHAYGDGGTPLGIVVSVTPTTAQVELYSTGGHVTEGWVGEKRIPVELTGRGAGAFEATLPRGSGATTTDVVYVPGPGALPIGTVVRIDTNPSSPRDVIYIAPYQNLFSLAWVTLST